MRALTAFLLSATITLTATAHTVSHKSESERNDGGWSLLGHFGDGLIGLVSARDRVDPEKLSKRALGEIKRISGKLEVREDVSDQMASIHIKAVRSITGDANLDTIENTLLLVEGTLTAKTIRDSIVIVKGPMKVRVVAGSALASSGDIRATHVGGRDHASLIMARGKFSGVAVYGSTIWAENGAAVDHPTYVQAINTDVMTPHPSRITHSFESFNPLEGLSAGIYLTP